MIEEFVCVQVHISDGVFQVLSQTFLERFYILCSLISCLGLCHSELRQTECCSLVIVLVNVYCFCLVVLFFHQSNRVFFRNFTGIYEFLSLGE